MSLLFALRTIYIFLHSNGSSVCRSTLHLFPAPVVIQLISMAIMSLLVLNIPSPHYITASEMLSFMSYAILPLTQTWSLPMLTLLVNQHHCFQHSQPSAQQMSLFAWSLELSPSPSLICYSISHLRPCRPQLPLLLLVILTFPLSQSTMRFMRMVSSSDAIDPVSPEAQLLPPSSVRNIA